jgi:hypothetical protein
MDLVVEAPQPPPELHPHLGVQCPEGLVQQQHLRLHRQGPGESHPLALPPREVGGPALRQLLHADEGEELVDHSPFALAVEGVGEVLPHGHVRKEGVVLENEADPPLL